MTSRASLRLTALGLTSALAVCLAATPSAFAAERPGACAAAVCVDSIEVDGKPAEEGRDVVVLPPGEAREQRVAVKKGASFTQGTVIETPSRPRVVIRLTTRNGNAVTLQAGSRTKVDVVGDQGERFTHLLGEARFAVVRALDFFEVAHDRFLAAVKGTEFKVGVDEKRAEIQFEWLRGEVVIEREVTVSIREEDPDDSSSGDQVSAATLIARDVLSQANKQLRYRLGPGQYLKEFGTFRDAEQYFRDQLAQDERSGDYQHIQRGLLGLGSILNTMGRPREAIVYFERALKAATDRKDEHWEAILARTLGFTHRDVKQYKRSIDFFQRWLRLEQRRSPAGASMGIARAYTALGRTYGNSGDARTWVEYVEQALEVQKRLYPRGEHEELAKTYKNLGDAYWAAGEQAKSMELHQASLDLKQKLQPNGVSWGIANSHRDLGLRYIELGKPDEGIDHLQKALAARIALFKGVHPSIAASYDDLGRTYRGRQDWDQAMTNFRKALDMRLQLFPDGVHRSIARSYLALARTAQDTGDAARAAEYTKRAREVQSKLKR